MSTEARKFGTNSRPDTMTIYELLICAGFAGALLLEYLSISPYADASHIMTGALVMYGILVIVCVLPSRLKVNWLRFVALLFVLFFAVSPRQFMWISQELPIHPMFGLAILADTAALLGSMYFLFCRSSNAWFRASR